jgi:transposase InsO family protein
MREGYEHISIGIICRWFGISRQAYYQHERNLPEEVLQCDLLLEEVKKIRKYHPRMGVRKLQEKLRLFMHENKIKMGRDALFDLLSAHKMLIRTRKRHVKTTNSYHWLKKHPNLIVDFIPSKPNELWVSDITYWQIQDQSVYLSLITDAYSRKITGYHLSKNLRAEETIKALEMALSDLEERTEISEQLFHHSDRGGQYCSTQYVNLLKNNHIKISMTERGDPRENAIAERVNGIIKDEYLLNYKCKNIDEARKLLAEAVFLYNMERPHSSIGNLAPEVVHSQYHQIESKKIKRLWKNYYSKNFVLANSV